MKQSTTYIVMGIIGLLIVVGAVLGTFIASLPKPDVKDVIFKSIETEDNFTYVNIDVDANNSFTIYAEDFAIYSDNIPIAAVYFTSGRYNMSELKLNEGNNSLTLRFNLKLSDVDQPIKITYKGDLFT